MGNLSSKLPLGQVSPTGDQVSLDPKMPNPIRDFNQLMVKLNVLPATSIISAFLTAEKRAVKIGHLIALLQLFSDEPLGSKAIELVHKFKSGLLQDIAATFSFLKNNPTGEQIAQAAEVTAEAVEIAATTSQGLADLKFLYTGSDTLITLPSTPEAPPLEARSTSMKDFLENNIPLIRVVVGFLALLAALFGMPKLLEGNWLSANASNLIKFSAMIRATDNITKRVSETSDELLSLAYSMFGAVYVPEKKALLLAMSAEAQKLEIEVRTSLDNLKLNVLATDCMNVSRLERMFEDLDSRFSRLTAEERSQYNIHTRLQSIHTLICSLRDFIFDLNKTKIGKQRPVLVWLCGETNRGKTYLMDQMCHQVGEQLGGSFYSRTVSDKHHNGYKGQLGYKIDDVLTTNDGEDVKEIMKYVGPDSKDTLGAALGDKGFPFVSKFFFVTSNRIWISQPIPITNFEAANRRRDFVVYCYNPAVDVEFEKTGQYPRSGEFFKKHPNRYFLIDPVFGHEFKNPQWESNLKFYPNAAFVQGEITLDQLKLAIIERQKEYAEDYRQRLAKCKDLKFNVPSHALVPAQHNI